MMLLRLQKLDPRATVPSKPYKGDAGIDVHALEKVTIPPLARSEVRTGLALELPKGCVGLVWDKSGLAKNAGITTMAGVIDEGYRGEIVVILVNLSKKPHTFEAGQKIAQVLIQKVEHVTLKEVKKLSVSQRGARGFGSSGK